MWKKLLLIIPLLFALQTQAQLREHANEAFGDKEYTRYSVYYSSLLTGNVVAGEATIEVKTHKKQFFDRPVWHIVGEGKSKGAFNWFYKVRDRFESYVDKEAMVPYLFIRRTREGDFVQDDDVYFYHNEKKAISRTATTAIPENVQDFVSALFYMRTLSLEDFDADSAYYLDFLLDDSVYISKIKYQGTEYIKTSIGTFRCLKIAPMMATGEVFADAYPVNVWVTDDKNHLPILAEAKIIVGSVKMELIDYKNLLNPIDAQVKKR
ncbi:MAG: DUF3108 domain-containing protein [Bacteroidales bacterium]|nr:DUF3108 domain-containing protein [Bacteroidales bacterium]